MSDAEVYIQQVHRVLPRVLALFDADPTSATYGQGDRFRWGWKLIDFGCALPQGVAGGLSDLVAGGLLPSEMDADSVMQRIDAMFVGARTLTRANGSIDQAFPHENSFGATGFLAHDLVTCVRNVGSMVDGAMRTRWLDVIQPLIGFLHRAEETHGLISNHLAGAAAALVGWAKLTGESWGGRAQSLLARVLAGQDEEGWFTEYEGADPGYQSRCLWYLAGLHEMDPALGLAEPIRRSLAFLWHFAHPDGSFGGLYGSRNTRFCFPAGCEAMADACEEAKALASFMRRSIAAHRVVALDVLDEGNLVPMFNCYCAAARIAAQRSGSASDAPVVPALSEGSFRRCFPRAGLIVDKGVDHYTVVSTHKGGVCYHYRDGGAGLIDAGAVARDKKARLYSTQAYSPANRVTLSGDEVTVEAAMVAMSRRLPTPWQFVILRIAAMTVMRIGGVREWVKRYLVRLLITRRRDGGAVNRRTIKLGRDLTVSDEWASNAAHLERVEKPGVFSAIHMASQGYWQQQDDAPAKGRADAW